MAILRVAQMGHPILRQVARPVTLEEIRSAAFQQLCDDMLETMEEYDGLGLAAPQVHHSVRVVVATLDDEAGPEFFVNPRITVLSDDQETTWEGCLSVDGIRGRVTRPCHVQVEALDRDGTPKAYELGGHPATVIQHECDHLDGTLYIDKADPRTLSFLREYKRYGKLHMTEPDGDDTGEDTAANPADELADFDDEIYGELTSEEFQHGRALPGHE